MGFEPMRSGVDLLSYCAQLFILFSQQKRHAMNESEKVHLSKIVI